MLISKHDLSLNKPWCYWEHNYKVSSKLIVVLISMDGALIELPPSASNHTNLQWELLTKLRSKTSFDCHSLSPRAISDSESVWDTNRCWLAPHESHLKEIIRCSQRSNFETSCDAHSLFTRAISNKAFDVHSLSKIELFLKTSFDGRSSSTNS